jgi:hypothetical protein
MPDPRRATAHSIQDLQPPLLGQPAGHAEVDHGQAVTGR